MGGWRRKKKACIQTGGLAELMGTRRGAFCGEIICIMGKWLELELRALLLWGQSVKWKERAPIRQKTNTKVLRARDVCS